MLSAQLMFRWLAQALRYAAREEASLAYALGQNRNIVDAFSFATATLTTTSVADPELVLDRDWMKIFTVLYQLVGIGILVEILRRLGLAFVGLRARERASAPR